MSIYLIGEIGINHNGDLEIAKKLMKGNIILDARNLLNKDEATKLEFKYEGVGQK